MAFHDYFTAFQGTIMHHPSIQISKRQALRQLTASTTGRPTRSAASFSDFQASSAQLGCCKKWTSKTPQKVGKKRRQLWLYHITHRIHGAAIYGNMDPINIPPMLAYLPAPWILWVISCYWYPLRTWTTPSAQFESSRPSSQAATNVEHRLHQGPNDTEAPPGTAGDELMNWMPEKNAGWISGWWIYMVI